MPKKINMTGQKWGEWTVLEEVPREPGTKGGVRWKCQCSCGNICEKEAQYLLNGDTKSCGCINKSYGEELIENILKENNISYIKEKIFSDLPLKRFDFYVNNSYIIEFDGKQHFKEDSGYGKNLKNTHKSDLEKNKYCFNKHIPIIRIPFDQIKNICYNMLILNNNTYILTEENESEYYNRYM